MLISHRLIAVLFVAMLSATAAANERYRIVLRDGSDVGERNLPRWNFGHERPHMGGKSLFDPANPARLLCDTQAKVNRRGPYVLMAGGDMLCGKIKKYRPSSSLTGAPAALIVALDGVLRSRDNNRVRVRADRVVGVVQRAGISIDQRQATARLKNGRTLTARSARWTPTGVALLTREGPVTVPFDDLLDLYVPYRNQAALAEEHRDYPSSNPQDLIARAVMSDGSVLTYRREHLFGAYREPLGEQGRHVHLVQPNWALEAIYMPVDKFVSRGFRQTHEVPLSSLAAETLSTRKLSKSDRVNRFRWQRNLSVHGEALGSEQLIADVGIGTHAPVRVAFDLPDSARSFATWIDLNQSARQGGCVRCKIVRDNINGASVWASEIMRGADPPKRVGPVGVSGAKRLVLVSETAHQGRPQGADPLDIRDDVDWLYPMVQLEPKAKDPLTVLETFLPGWNRWKSNGDPRRFKLAKPRWSQAHDRWFPVLRIEDDSGVTLTRTVKVSTERDLVFFELAAEKSLPTGSIELRIGDVKLTARRSERNRKQVFLWDLTSLRGTQVTLSLHLAGVDKTGGLEWLGLGIGSTSQLLP